MKIAFDPKKSEKNEHERGLPFDKCVEFELETALYKEDARKDYPERRFVGIGYIDERLPVICFTQIDGGVRIISFRKANSREVRNYEKEITNK